MKRFLPRGFRLNDGSRVRNILAQGEEWQITDTDQNDIVLAISEQQLQNWKKKIPNSQIMLEGMHYSEECWYLPAKSGYLISSLVQGPYPNSANQIDAFSRTFRRAVEEKLLDRVEDAIYFEEYSLILPIGAPRNDTDEQTLYGQWLTGGLAVRATSISMLSRVMSWLPKDVLKELVELAGFNPEQEKQDEERNPSQDMATVAAEKKEEFFTLPGRPQLEEFFRENIIAVVQNQAAYARMGIFFPGATVLYGPPGSGKTYAVGKLVDYLGWQRFDIDSSSIGSTFIHDTSKKISEVFKSAIDHAPSILVIDEMEAFLSQRSNAGPGTHHLEEVAEFLRRIPEAVEKRVLIFAMTNMLDSIDPAIIRRGRFDYLIKVDLANEEEIEALLRSRFQELPVSGDVEIKTVAKALANRPLSDVAYVLKEAGRFAVKRNQDRIDNNCLSDAIDLLPKKKEKTRIGF